MAKELETFEAKRVLPMVVLGVLLVFVPAVTYVTLQTTASMFKVQCSYLGFQLRARHFLFIFCCCLGCLLSGPNGWNNAIETENAVHATKNTH